MFNKLYQLGQKLGGINGLWKQFANTFDFGVGFTLISAI